MDTGKRLPEGVLQAVKYLEDTYQTVVRVSEDPNKPWRFYLHLPEMPYQKFSLADIRTLSNYNCYRSTDDPEHHFYTAL